MADKYPELGFKFAIGDDVMFAVSVREAAALSEGQKQDWLKARPQRFTIIERLIVECYGGVQRCYDLRGAAMTDRLSPTVGVTGTVTPGGYLRAAETELVAVVDAPSTDQVESVAR